MGHRRARHFYPRSPCGERPAIGRRDRAGRDISIHALLAESDRLSMSAAPLARPISIHALLAESDPRKAVTTRGNHRYFYPRSPCGERLLRRFPNMSLRIISIHALLAESDGGRCPPRHRHGRFLSTLSLRRATLSQDYTEQPTDISIHALLAESDLDALCARCPGLKFLSTLSLRRATCQRWQLCCADRDFYPRSPCGERLSMDALESYLINISIHALLAESDDP